MNVAILSVIYYEPEWIQTCQDLAAYAKRRPIFFVDRGGTGGLATAINHGMIAHGLWEYEAIWVVTNVRFGPNILEPLIDALKADHKLAAIHPAFASDHAFLRPTPGCYEVKNDVPFVEFTAPLVRGLVMASTLLDERMPYSGHDLDWGYRVRQKGCHLAVHKGVTLNHTYLRHSASVHPVTAARRKLREQWEPKTKALIRQLYGTEHAILLGSAY